MRETRLSGSEGGGAKPIASPYPYHKAWGASPRKPAQNPPGARGTGDTPLVSNGRYRLTRCLRSEPRAWFYSAVARSAGSVR